MTGYLDGLVMRGLGEADVVRPRPPARFEPSATVVPWAGEVAAEREVRAAVRTRVDVGMRDPSPAIAESPADPGQAARPSEMPVPERVAASHAPARLSAAAAAVGTPSEPLPAGTPAAVPHPPAARALVREPTVQTEPTPAIGAQRPVDPILPRPVLQPPPPSSFDRRQIPQSTDRRSAEPPVVRIEIGRIEVSTPVPAPAPPARKPRRSAPAMSLDDYLRGTSG